MTTTCRPKRPQAQAPRGRKALYHLAMGLAPTSTEGGGLISTLGCKDIMLISVYLVLMCFCILNSIFPGASGGTPTLLKTIWLALQMWTFGMVVFACRSRLDLCITKAFTNVFGSAAPPEIAGLSLRKSKVTRTGEGGWFSFAACEMQGWRPAMEDAVVCEPKLNEGIALFAVFDGHGGAEVSALASQQLVERLNEGLPSSQEDMAESVRRTLLDIEEDLRWKNDHGQFDLTGSTASVALLTPTGLTVVNVGDSRVLKCHRGECVPLTRDHKPESPRERRRIEAAGGSVVNFGPCYRIDFGLNLSRTLADFKYKDPGLPPEQQKISPVGDVTMCKIEEGDEFIIVACDGLFELMTWDSVCEYVHQRIEHMPLDQIAEGLLDACCSENVVKTRGCGTDNESVIIVRLRRG